MGVRWRDAAALGVLMNTRGLVELIVLDIGRRLGILSFELFTMLVITALVTTFMTSPLLDVIIGRPDKANDGRPRPCPRSSAP
jgi:Kef-type K+ transport system membrane component KefB